MNDFFVAYINSKNRLSGTDSNFTYKIEFPPHKTYNRVCVTRIHIPKSYKLISEPDNYFILREGDQEAKISFHEGNCGRRDFIKVLTRNLNQLSPHGWEYKVEYAGIGEIDDAKLTYRVSGNSNVQPEFVFGKGLYELMGFDMNSTNKFEAGKLRSKNQISYQIEDTLYLHSNLIKNTKRSILQDVFVSGNPYFSSITWECCNTFLNSKQLDGVHELVSFALTDEDDYPINLNGNNMVITLFFYNIVHYPKTSSEINEQSN